MILRNLVVVSASAPKHGLVLWLRRRLFDPQFANWVWKDGPVEG